jgi:UDP-N-acetylmuramate dehydrogenase
MTSHWQKQVSEMAGADVFLNETMAPHTTYKVGGPVTAFIELDTRDALSHVVDLLDTMSVSYLVVGNGSNVLFADKGFEGAVLHLGRGFQHVNLSRDALETGIHLLEVGGGLTITRLIRVLKSESISGVEYLGGVPGTIGGALRMNAGTVMGEVSDTLHQAELYVPGKGYRWLPASDLHLRYRHSEIPSGAVITGARFRCAEAEPDTLERLARVLTYRKQTQPLQQPSCGSVFANPPGDHAGRLIEACALKGHRIGGAEVSEIHANWIVNNGKATADDIRLLIGLCVERVQAKHQVALRHEVQLLGDWD